MGKAFPRNGCVVSMCCESDGVSSSMQGHLQAEYLMFGWPHVSRRDLLQRLGP